ncbi:MAG: sensor histidine kinase [Chitinophagales bacterium]|nr:sensor histidine kinase [Chitinophagales bacterium]
MKNPTKWDIAIYVSLLTALIVLISLFGFKAYFEIPTIFLITIPLITFVSSYFLVVYMVERFVYRKIKILYKTIHNLKTGKSLKKQFAQEASMLESVEQEVLDYTKSKSDEILELKKMEQYRKEFLGNVSHELKTPIFNIQGYIDTLLNGGLEDEKINKDYLLKASYNADRLSNIVEELMLISQYESGALELNFSEFDIRKLIVDQFDIFEMQADLKDIKLKFKKGTTKPVSVYADKKRVTQVLNNLLSNSIKYGNEGGTTSIGIYNMEENILVEVNDNGNGIPKEHLQRLFERFYRVDSSRSRELGGTGLGLSIVKHIIEAHQQTISVRSTVGKGTTFAFSLKKAQ